MLNDFFDGVKSYGKAFSVISEMRLWGYVLVPGIISVLLAMGIGTTAWYLSEPIGSWLLSWYPFEWGSIWLGKFSNFVGGALVGLGGLIVYKHLVLAISSPFMSPLSQKVEERMTGNYTNYKGFQINRAIKELFRGLYIAIRNIIRELFYVAILFFLSFIPVVGIIATFLIFLVQAFYAGFGNIDYTLERHKSVYQSVRFNRRYRGLAIGNGTVFLLLLMTGVGFLIAPPLAAVAGTLESVKRLEPVALPEEAEDLV